jgi:glutamine---fructose-6-phosphate transaminase (isomerizing)
VDRAYRDGQERQQLAPLPGGLIEFIGGGINQWTAAEGAELLSIFSLTVAVQRIALESAETLGTNPDTFGLDLARRDAWKHIEL